MISFTPVGSRAGDKRALFAETFRRQIALIEAGQARCRVPQTRALYERRAGMAFHFKPELFVQLGGTTDFAVPEGAGFTLAPNEVCVMPRAVPHGEVARDGHGPFENVVVCFYNDTVAIHVAHRGAAGRPVVDDIHFYTTDYYQDLVEYLNRIGELPRRAPAVSATAIKGLLLAEFSLLLALVADGSAQRFSETERIFKCQWLIRNNLGDPELSVAWLADELRCSPKHLSRIFQQNLQERMVEHIARLRLRNAVEALRTTALSVKEVAAACGYQNANYFARVFRQATQRSPHEFRAELRQVACAVEKQPKVVYFDREEYGFGLRPEVLAAAEVAPP